MTLLLNESDVRALLKMPELIETMERTLAQFSTGRARQPVRTAIEVNERDFFGIMPAQLESPAALGAKLVTVFHGNEQRGLPSHLAVIVLLDPATGRLEAVMDGRYITAMRTAAASAVAVRWLAHANAAILAILGSGVQARSHLELLPLVRNFGEARVWSPNAGHLAQFLDSAGSTAGISIPVCAVISAEKAVRDADVIVLATSSATPVIQNDWLKPGALVVSVGACRPNMREMDPALVARARVIVDSLNESPFYRFNRWVGFLRKRRTALAVHNVPNVASLQELRREFERVEISYHGVLTFLIPVLRPLFGPTRAGQIVSGADRWLGWLQQWAFKVVVVAQGTPR